jgi:hypothetical protein
MQLSRRNFIQFLSAAPIALAFDPHRKIFDMGRQKIWTPPPPEIAQEVGLEAWYTVDLGGAIDRSMERTLAQYGVGMEQTYIHGNGEQRVLLATYRKPSL